MPERASRKRQEPEIVEMPPQTLAVVHTEGDPGEVGPQVIPALYGAVYSLKFARKKEGTDFKVGALRARWPNAHLVPKERWTGVWGLPVPEGTASLAQKAPGVEVRPEVWEYGTVAQILHIGPYSEEMPTVKRLHEFIAARGYEIAGPHEEEYLTRPEARVQKTIIRYAIRKPGA